jgi:DNA polymerase-3 subunit delta'
MVVGEDGQVQLPWLEAPLRQALAQQRSHALLVRGAQGVGALDFLLILAQAWLCEDPTEAMPCGRCSSCHLVQKHGHPDLLVLLPEAQRAALDWGGASDDSSGDGGKARKKPSRQIKIDEVRVAIDWVVQSSSRGRAKVIVLHPAEAMNLQAASALLKTLEEPPGQARLLLSTTDPARLLPTLRSRCQHLALAPPDAEAGCRWLARQGVTDAPVLLAAAGGAPLAASALAAMGLDGERWLTLPRAVAEGQSAAFNGWHVPQVVDTLQKICHDALVRSAGGEPRYFPAQALPAGADAAQLLAWSRSLGRVARHDEHPWNEGLLVEAMVSEGRACWQEATSSAPAKRRPLDTLAR